MASIIGTYNFKTSSTTEAAVSIVSPGVDLPALRKVSGVECVIHDVAKVARRDYLTGPSNLIPTWSVYLIGWPPATGDDITAGVIRLMELFGGAVSNETVAVAGGLGAFAQSLISIRADSPILPL